MLAQLGQLPIQQTGIILVEFEQATQVLEAVDVDMLPLQAPIAIIHQVSNFDAGVNRSIFTEEQRQCARFTGIDIEVVGWFDQHAFE